MATKGTILARRSWNLLRLAALLWMKKGGALKRGLIKCVRRTTNHDSIHYREKEFSFDDTPIFHFKMHRPNSMRFLPSLPCIKAPQVDFDFDFNLIGDDHEDCDYNQECRKSYLRGDGMVEDYNCGDEMVPLEDEGIDHKAEEFIGKFYEQMKLQRQISYLQYKEMLSRGTSL